MSSFKAFALPQTLQHAIDKLNYTTATPIQSQAIPPALEGKDILGTAETGTGKTAAFTIPLIAKLMEDDQAGAIVLLPTRELAAQVEKAVRDLASGSEFRTALLIGGDSMGKQISQLHRKPRIIIGTPGRVNDHLKRGTLNLSKTRIVVLDETDRMLDMGFGIQIETIIEKMPEERQTLMFSATMPRDIIKLANRYLNDPVRISIGETNKTAANVELKVVETVDGGKYEHLIRELNERNGSVIIFVKTKYGADRLAKRLSDDDFESSALHGDLRQHKRTRVINAFREQTYRILVATDVAARGLDIPHIEHVINYDLPQAPEDFIHRIGRTGRAGAKGQAVSFVAPSESRKWFAIERMLNPNEKPARRDVANNNQQKRNDGGFKKGKSKRFGDKRFERRDDKRRDNDVKFERDDKPFGERKPFGKKSFNKERRFDRDEGESKHFGDRKPFNKERRFDREDGERKPFGKKSFNKERRFDREDGERKPFGKKPFNKERRFDREDGERKPFGKKPFNKEGRFGEDRPRRDRFEVSEESHKPSFGKKPFGKSHGKSGGKHVNNSGDKPVHAKGKFGKPNFSKHKSHSHSGRNNQGYDPLRKRKDSF